MTVLSLPSPLRVSQRLTSKFRVITAAELDQLRAAPNEISVELSSVPIALWMIQAGTDTFASLAMLGRKADGTLHILHTYGVPMVPWRALLRLSATAELGRKLTKAEAAHLRALRPETCAKARVSWVVTHVASMPAAIIYRPGRKLIEIDRVPVVYCIPPKPLAFDALPALSRARAAVMF